jgi:hypothetical protein
MARLGSWMWRFAVAALLLFSATPCRAGCHYDRFRFYTNFDTSTTMRTTSGAQCTINLVIKGIDSIAVTESARHGVASYNGGIGYPKISYRSSSGYKGADSFVFSLTGANGVAHVKVSVDVE